MKTFGFALLVFAVGIGASQAQTSTTSSNANKITVTGCVQRSSSAEAPTGTSGTVGAGMPDTQFILANASAGASTAGTSGSTTPASSATAPRYRLDDAAASKITPHVGHKVEISGTLDEQSRSMSSPSTAGATSSGAAAPKIKVDSVKMIASTCSE